MLGEDIALRSGEQPRSNSAPTRWRCWRANLARQHPRTAQCAGAGGDARRLAFPGPRADRGGAARNARCPHRAGDELLRPASRSAVPGARRCRRALRPLDEQVAGLELGPLPPRWPPPAATRWRPGQTAGHFCAPSAYGDWPCNLNSYRCLEFQALRLSGIRQNRRCLSEKYSNKSIFCDLNGWCNETGFPVGTKRSARKGDIARRRTGGTLAGAPLSQPRPSVQPRERHRSPSPARPARWRPTPSRPSSVSTWA